MASGSPGMQPCFPKSTRVTPIPFRTINSPTTSAPSKATGKADNPPRAQSQTRTAIQVWLCVVLSQDCILSFTRIPTVVPCSVLGQRLRFSSTCRVQARRLPKVWAGCRTKTNSCSSAPTVLSAVSIVAVSSVPLIEFADHIRFNRAVLKNSSCERTRSGSNIALFRDGTNCGMRL